MTNNINPNYNSYNPYVAAGGSNAASDSGEAEMVSVPVKALDELKQLMAKLQESGVSFNDKGEVVLPGTPSWNLSAPPQAHVSFEKQPITASSPQYGNLGGQQIPPLADRLANMQGDAANVANNFAANNFGYDTIKNSATAGLVATGLSAAAGVVSSFLPQGSAVGSLLQTGSSAAGNVADAAVASAAHAYQVATGYSTPPNPKSYGNLQNQNNMQTLLADQQAYQSNFSAMTNYWMMISNIMKAAFDTLKAMYQNLR